MPRHPVTAAELTAALADASAGAELPPDRQRAVVRTTLHGLAQLYPGRSVEIRVPPVAAVQAVTGPRHTRGTPPNVVETDPGTWLELVTGRLSFATGVADGRIRASGTRADLSPLLPLVAPEPSPGSSSEQ